MKEKLLEIFWNNKLLSENNKEKVFYKIKNIIQGKNKIEKISEDDEEEYIKNVLKLSYLNNSFSVNWPTKNNKFLKEKDVKLFAYYLPQYYPEEHNNKWWGKGSTEWTNVSKAVPQYVGHYQPRLPGELGFYDLRIQDNIYRQIELAEIYGIYGFCFYYYWFDGVRLLDLPFDNFANDPKIDFPFFICWVNESWTRQWSSSSEVPLIIQSKDINSYKNFIVSCYKLFVKKNYFCIDGKPVLNIYKPFNIPDVSAVIEYWRNFIFQKLEKELYIIACIGYKEDYQADYLKMGFDAVNEFAPGPYIKYFKNITESKKFVCDEFYGKIYDYKDFVENKKYFLNRKGKLYKAVTPMWDNTARKINKGMILDGASPVLYKKWLKDIILFTKTNKTIDDNIVFINAWNEWAEGAYLEPDLKWKYGYLEATRDAIIETR